MDLLSSEHEGVQYWIGSEDPDLCLRDGNEWEHYWNFASNHHQGEFMKIYREIQEWVDAEVYAEFQFYLDLVLSK